MDDLEVASDHIRKALAALGFGGDHDQEMEATPLRFATMLKEVFRTTHLEPPVPSTFPHPDPLTTPHDPVVLCDLPYHSFCVHHLLPFFGTFDIAFIPSDTLLGFGSAGQVIDHFAAQPQVQERLVGQVGRLLHASLDPQGLLIRCRARQMCMEVRGSQKRGVTVAMHSTGVLTSGAMREEVMRQFVQQESLL